MDTLTVLIVLALAATAVSLVPGIRAMARGEEYDTLSTRYMTLRVGLQAVAFALLLVAIYLKAT
jgi:DUF2909 family protein/hypoxia induced protein